MNVGLTGGIATGKSTVASMFQQRGAVLLDADQFARAVVAPQTEGAQRIREAFGDSVFTPEGELDRAALGRRIFACSQERKTLNRLLHPLIMGAMQQQAKETKERQPHAILLWDIPLLYEEDLTRYVEKVIVVYVPERVQINRLLVRDSLQKEEAIQRIQAQMSIEEKKKRADYVIDNQGFRENTERQVDQIWSYLTLKNGSNRPS